MVTSSIKAEGHPPNLIQPPATQAILFQSILVQPCRHHMAFYIQNQRNKHIL